MRIFFYKNENFSKWIDELSNQADLIEPNFIVNNLIFNFIRLSTVKLPDYLN